MAIFLGKGFGTFLYYFIPLRKKVAKFNLKIAFPTLSSSEKNTLILKTYKHFGILLIEFFRKNKINLENQIKIDNETRRLLSLKKGIAEFPDAITERGSKHLKELQKIRNKRTRAIMLYLIQRDDCKYFRIAKEIDEKYNLNLKKAIKSGVEILCYNCRFKNNKIEMDKKIKFIDNA